MILAGGQSHAASHHLLVERTDLCGSKDYDAVNGGTVPALREEHTVAQNIVFSVFECREYLGAVGAVAVYLCRFHSGSIQHGAKFLRGCNKRQKHNGSSAFAIASHLVCDPGEIRFERVPNLSGGKVSVRYADICNIQFERYHLRTYRAQIAVTDCLGHAVLVGLGVEILSEIFHIAPVGSRRNAENVGVRKMVKHTPVAVRKAVMRFVHDNVLKVVIRKSGESFFLRQRLHRADRHRQ